MTFDDEEEERVVNSRVNDEGGSSSRRRRYKDAAMINQCIDGSIKLFEHVHAPSLAHRDRQKVYAVLEELFEGVSASDRAWRRLRRRRRRRVEK